MPRTNPLNLTCDYHGDLIQEEVNRQTAFWSGQTPGWSVEVPTTYRSQSVNPNVSNVPRNPDVTIELPGTRDVRELTAPHQGIPLPVHHADFSFTARDLDHRGRDRHDSMDALSLAVGIMHRTQHLSPERQQAADRFLRTVRVYTDKETGERWCGGGGHAEYRENVAFLTKPDRVYRCVVCRAELKWEDHSDDDVGHIEHYTSCGCKLYDRAVSGGLETEQIGFCTRTLPVNTPELPKWYKNVKEAMEDRMIIRQKAAWGKIRPLLIVEAKQILDDQDVLPWYCRVTQAPMDATDWGVFADWLEEHGYTHHAAFIQQCLASWENWGQELSTIRLFNVHRETDD